MLFSSWLYLHLAASVTFCVFLVERSLKKTKTVSFPLYSWSSHKIYHPVIKIKVVLEMLLCIFFGGGEWRFLLVNPMSLKYLNLYSP